MRHVELEPVGPPIEVSGDSGKAQLTAQLEAQGWEGGGVAEAVRKVWGL